MRSHIYVVTGQAQLPLYAEDKLWPGAGPFWEFILCPLGEKYHVSYILAICGLQGYAK